MRELYDENFYENRDESTRLSAEIVASFLHAIVQPTSVVDVGCGVGTWLSAFRKLGATEILGLDGEWVDKDKLVIPATSFMQSDLTAPRKLDRSFDLAISLEVAEHVPSNKAGGFVDFLTSLAPLVMFSAAIPKQGGVGHVNERWPSYWIPLFSDRGFVVIDLIRPEIWDHPDLLVWYAQNILLFVREDKKELLSRLQVTRRLRHEPYRQSDPIPTMVDVVHPRMFGLMTDANEQLSRKNETLEIKLRQLHNEVEALKVEQLSIKGGLHLLIRNVLKKLASR